VDGKPLITPIAGEVVTIYRTLRDFDPAVITNDVGWHPSPWRLLPGSRD
jgi:hypothetical protein